MKPLLPALLLFFVGTACETNRPSTPRSTAAADALLLEVSPAEQQRIATSRERCDRANDAYAAAKAHTSMVRDAQISADLDLEEAKTKVTRAKANLARKSNVDTSEAIAVARQELADAESEQAELIAAATLGAKRTDHARALADIAKEHVTVAEARVELAKARAVNTLDRPASQKPLIKRFEESVRRAEADENLARTRAEATQKEIDILGMTNAAAPAGSR